MVTEEKFKKPSYDAVRKNTTLSMFVEEKKEVGGLDK